MPGIFGGSHHFLYLFLLHIEGKFMGKASLRIVVLERNLIKLEAPVGGDASDAIFERFHFLALHRCEILRDPEILTKNVGVIHARDGDRDAGHTHGVAEGLFGSEDAFFYRISGSAQRFHSEHGHAAPLRFRNHLLLKAEERPIEGVERHLHGIEVKARVQHFQVNSRILVASEADEPYLALFLRLLERFGRAIRTDEQIGVILK